MNRQKTDGFYEDYFDDEELDEADDDISTFDRAEFCGDKPLSRQTLERMMKMLKVPKHRWNRIATDILKEEQVKKN